MIDQHAFQPMSTVCRVRDLTVSYRVDGKEYAAIRDVNLEITRGKITAIIGESGSGKSTLAYAMLNGIPHPGRVSKGSIAFDDVGDILQLKGDDLRRVRGRKISMVFQATQSTLNPLRRVGAQILDLARSHGIKDTHKVLQSAIRLAKRMSLDPERVLASYQHQLSGGMRQRVNLIFALLLDPEVLILDEPTTALDVLSQSSVLQIIHDIQAERNLSIILITHDIGVVAEVAHTVAVMYAGQLVEQGSVSSVVRNPQHPYTRGLISALPRLTGDIEAAQPIPGSPPQLATIPKVGCVFRERCTLRKVECDSTFPPTRKGDIGDHTYVCHVEVMSK